ncbi:MAG: hypothetical protein ACTSVD_06700 [Candidatus Thorarchaeota archaeon]
MVDDSVEQILVHELTDGMMDMEVDSSYTSDIPANTPVYISGDGVVLPFLNNVTEANAKKYLGYTVKPWKYGYDTVIAVQTKYRNLVNLKSGQASLTAGMTVKWESGSGAKPLHVIEWAEGSDYAHEIVGLVHTGGDDEDTVKVFMP